MFLSEGIYCVAGYEVQRRDVCVRSFSCHRHTRVCRMRRRFDVKRKLRCEKLPKKCCLTKYLYFAFPSPRMMQ